MFVLENQILRVSIEAKGAELKSVYRKDTGLEYMWSGDPAFWGKTSPVLFPIVGALKNNSYNYAGKSFQMARHGFARDMPFMPGEQLTDSITFTLESSEETLKKYPFHFSFSISYRLRQDTLDVVYKVTNKGPEEMHFSVGAHPAFKVPLVEGTTYEDYRLVFEKKETAGRWPISKDGLIERSPLPLLDNTDTLPLSKTLFSKDALVLKHLLSDSVQLLSFKTPHGLRFSFPGFPYLGLWAAPGADFLCIEPWCGIADSVDTDQEIEHKEGVRTIQPSATFSVQWSAVFF